MLVRYCQDYFIAGAVVCLKKCVTTVLLILLSTVAYVVLVCALYFRMSLFSICFAFIDHYKMSRKINGKVVFSESWLGDERFKTWLKWGSDCHKVVCIFCNNSVADITRMGVSALVSDAAGTKHKERLRTYNPISSLCFMNKNVNKDTPEAISTPGVDSLTSSVAVSHAEIYCFGHTFHIVHV